MCSKTATEEVDRFAEIMEEIQDLAREAVELLPKGLGLTARAESYWYPTITGCVDGRATMTTMDETKRELEEYYDRQDN